MAPHPEWIDADAPDEAQIARAVALLEGGQLVVFPTDTVYGVAAHPDRPEAVAQLYALKQRPTDQPIARLAGDACQVEDAEPEAWSRGAEALAAAWWPGALTLVLPYRGGTMGWRVPDHGVPRAIARAVGQPLVVTSANPHGSRDATDAATAAAYFPIGVDCILDSGPSPVQVPSTVTSLLASTPQVLREGVVTRKMIEETWVY